MDNNFEKKWKIGDAVNGTGLKIVKASVIFAGVGAAIAIAGAAIKDNAVTQARKQLLEESAAKLLNNNNNK